MDEELDREEVINLLVATGGILIWPKEYAIWIKDEWQRAESGIYSSKTFIGRRFG